MTTPNIKALAERIKQLSAKSGSLSWYEVDELTRLQGQAHVLADALLRVMDDSRLLARELALVMNAAEVVSPGCIDMNEPEKALESHNKLMEELGGE